MIDDVPVDLFWNAVDFHRIRLVDRVEQSRKRVAKIKAATAAVAGIKDTLKLLKQRSFLVELFGLPVQRVPCWRLETALSPIASQLTSRRAYRVLFGIGWHANAQP